MAERKFSWPARSETTLIGKDIPRIDGVAKASGQAKYTADINTKGTLFAVLLTCPYAAAKVKSIDLEPARKMPGVKSVFPFKKEKDEIRWEGDLVAAVAAERTEQAEDAVKAIVVEYEQLPFFVDEADVKRAAFADRTKGAGGAKKGDVEAALKTAAVVHRGHYGIATISHMCLEPHGSHCGWKDDDLEAHLSTQNVSGTPGQFAEPLGIDAANVTVVSDYEGGGFGSKFAVGEWGVACAKMAKEAGRPVRLMLDRATELKIAGTRPSGYADVTVAADADGTVVAWDSLHWGTAGIGGGGVAVGQMPYPFDFPNRSTAQIGISCNTGPNQAWRAPPHPQLCAMTQTALDDLAAKLNMDSYDFFKKNLQFTQFGKAEVYAAEMEIAAKAIDWKKKWHPRGEGEKGAVKRGLGMALHTWGGGAGACTCSVKVHPDGSVETFLGSQDIGTGTRTIIAITLAETFGLAVEDIKVNLGSSKYSRSDGSGGSITVGGVSGAHRRAAQTALWQIFDKVAEKHKIESADALVARGGKILNGKKEVCTWKQACSLLGVKPLEVQGEGPKKDGLTSERVGGVQMVDLSVDTETGLVRIHKFVAVQDCGLILDELTARSQVLGALIMGISYSLSEERIMDNKTGRYINADLENYKLPRIGDVGELVAIMYQPDSEYDKGVVGLGEPPVISPGAAISNAVANACGVRVPILPLTPKRVLDALKGGKA
ncbi:MAG TPA: xanthine dehydrogenase family protein molybdopterin-binding subunit [Planctomycetaceae bacterium]|nr:xanthine dehydrogenase family protein molybdopterin-binding subunit [Planctomycetaceae bacterium]